MRGTKYALAASAATLVDLDLGNAGIGDGGVIAIADVAMPKLERLWIGKNTVTSKSMTRLRAANGLAKLKVLDLSNNAIGFEGIVALGASNLPALPRLQGSRNTSRRIVIRARRSSPSPAAPT